MAQLAISAVGAGIGALVGGPVGAQVGWMVGSVVGSLLFQEDGPAGPKLEDLKVQASTYGAPIPIVYGTTRLAGNIIWSTDLEPHTEEESAKGGPSIESTTYTVSCAIGLCEGEIAGVTRIWANKKLVYDVRASNTSNTISADFTGAPRVYLGNETQTADSLIVAHKGSSTGYRGLAYVVLEDFKLANFGNRMPQWEFEVVKSGTTSIPDPIVTLDADAVYDLGALGDGFRTSPFMDPDTGYMWTVTREPGPHWFVYVYDERNATMVARIPIPPITGSDVDSAFVTAGGNKEFWICWQTYLTGAGTPFIAIVNVNALTYTESIGRDAAVTSWASEIEYHPDSGQVVIGSSNLGNDLYFYEPIGRTYLGALSGVGSSPGTLYAWEGVDIVLRKWSSSSSVGVARFDGTWTAKANFTSWENFGTFVYDGARDRIVYFPPYQTDPIRLIDPATLAVTTVTNPNTASVSVALYHQQNDRYYVIGNVANNRLSVINPDTLAIEASYTYGSASGNLGYLLEVPGITDYLAVQGGYFASEYRRVYVTPRLTAAAVNLGDIVSGLCLRTALTSGDLNVTALTDAIDGYVVGNQMSARAAIEPLQQAYYFDGVESDNALKFVKRGGAIAVTIPEDDRAARDAGQALPDALRILRAHEQEIPVQFDIEYFDRDADHLIGSQYERRITRSSDGTQNIRLPIVMSATKGKQVAMVNLYTAWLARQRYSFSTSRKYAKYEPTDVVTLPTAAATYNARIVAKREGANGVIEWEAVAEDASAYTQTGVPGESGYVPQTIVLPSSLATFLALMDVALLRDTDDNAGFYAAASGLSEDWSGANLYSSSNEGYSYSRVESFANGAAVMGYTQSVLANFSGGNILDEGSTLTVALVGGTLSNASQLDVLNGANAAVIGSEIVQFTSATLTEPDTYELSGFLRGRRGTEWAMGAHAVGELFVLASATAWRRPNPGTAEIGLERRYKAPAFGTLLSSAAAQDFTNNGVGLKPYAPVLLAGSRDGSSNLTITWIRRTRLGGEWRDNVDASLGEASENHDIEIYTTDFVTLKRTLTATSQSVSYTASQQTTDFGSPQASVGVKVYQVSATVGRGYVLQGLV